MGLIQDLKTNIGVFCLRTKEEVDMLFVEIRERGQTIDKQLDYAIRMALRKVKLQLYYEEKLAEYKPLSETSKRSESVNIAPTKAIKTESKKKAKKHTKKKKSSLEKYDDMVKGLTKEELIAINKARVAQYHPEPDLSYVSPSYMKALRQVQKENREREKKRPFVSIVSIPMGGMNKR